MKVKTNMSATILKTVATVVIVLIALVTFDWIRVFTTFIVGLVASLALKGGVAEQAIAKYDIGLCLALALAIAGGLVLYQLVRDHIWR